MLIKDLLMDQKVFEAIADVGELMQANKIDYDSYIVSFKFEKKIFKDRAEVVEWLSKYGYAHSQISEEGDDYVITNYEAGIFDEITFLDIRRGVSIVIGRFTPVMNHNPYVFSLKNGKEGIKFKEEIPSIIEVARVVEGYHASYGKVKITKEDLQSMKRNFDEGVVGIDISFDFEHNQAEAAAWLQKVFLSEDGNTLLGQVKWTPEGAVALTAKKFRYFSPEFTHNYVHPHTRKEHGPTLLGGGLVNRPFLKMDAIVEMSESDKNKGSKMSKELQDKIDSLNGEIALKDKGLNAAATSIATLKEENSTLGKEVVALKEEVKTLKDAAAKKDLEAKNQKLFDEGKINAAQLKALNEGKDAFEVLSLSTEMNNTPNGKPPGKEVITLSEEENALCKMLDLTPEEYRAANPVKGDK